MTTDSVIILLKKENQLLRERLAIAEQWIGREIRQMQFRKEKEETQKTTKIGLMETEEGIIERSKKYFGEFYPFLSQENQELIIEGEINFSHLVRKKELDGFMIANIYQKILENIFEEEFTKHFREKYRKSHLHPGKNNLLEKTLYKVLQNNFRLSLGKIYLILQELFAEKRGDLIVAFQTSIEQVRLYRILSFPQFWEIFTDIIDTQAFGEKRHSGKISLKDARRLRHLITGNFEETGLLKILLQHMK